MSTVTKMAVENVDGMNRCVNCGQRAGIDMAGNGEGFYVHDRTGLVQCGEFEFVSSSPAWFVGSKPASPCPGCGITRHLELDIAHGAMEICLNPACAYDTGI